eukprot:TRINITY_DN26282_c0_g1_i3.p1 TRINITY_DN26282_c0_g1~~TRINITY_DN26282_c0_g1_i3.p1  ORF type:complete len:382 (+),score=137.02 TRINITY_DN26282_c0_g1_i3:91-1236(+)
MDFFFFFQAEDGIRDAQESRGLGDVYKRQIKEMEANDLLAQARAMASQTSALFNAEEVRKGGNELFKAGEYEAAEAEYRAAMKVITDFEELASQPDHGMADDPMKPEAPNLDPEMKEQLHAALVSCWLNIAMCNLKMQDYPGCVVACDAAISMKPDTVKAHYRRGQAHLALKRFGAAKTDLRAALDLAPTDAAVIKALHQVREDKKNADEDDKKLIAGMVSGGGLYKSVGWAYPRVFLQFGLDGFVSAEDGSQIELERVVIELFTDRVPKTCENFRALCTGEMGMGKVSGKPLHYKGTKITNIQPGFVVQGGDIVNNDGTDGECIYGGYFEDENYKVRHSDAGIVTMVNKGPGTNNSQWGVMLCPAAVSYTHLTLPTKRIV